jgi:glycosyltransferase involved in cell wall biosynthesis
MESTEGPIGLPRILHLASTVTDEVFGVLGPATRELSRMGRLQSIVLFDEARTRDNVERLRCHAELVGVDVADGVEGRARYRALYEACCREIVRSRPSTLHFHGLAACVVGALALRRSGVTGQVLYSLQERRSRVALRAAGWLIRVLAQRSLHPARRAAVTTFPLEDHAPGSRGLRHLVEHPVHAAFLAAPRDEAPAPRVLSGGTHAGTRAIDILSQIAVLLSAEALDIEFRWLGRMDGSTASRFHAAGIRIVDTDDEAVQAMEFARGWLYVAPWWTQGYPLFLIEAMAAGLPGVVLDCPRHRQVVEHGTTGFVCASGDEMVRAVALLLDDPALRRRMGDAARECTRARFGPRPPDACPPDLTDERRDARCPTP